MQYELLLTSSDLDKRLRYPRGRAARLARRGYIPFIALPDGSVRFDPKVIERWLRECSAKHVAPEVEAAR